MDSYIDIKLKPDSKMQEAELSSKVYTKFHEKLAKLKTNQIGISFPLVNVSLGRLFRIHGEINQLKAIQDLEWLGSLSGYCQISDIKPVPQDVKYRVISAKRSNLSHAKLKRLIARGNIDKAGERRYKVKMLSEYFDDPFLDLFSSTTRQVYRKFFDFSEIQESATKGKFDSYGLSRIATIPWF